ncbi:hypothetical protein PR048_031859 [Dryococelus australis]|uniref:Uncharacterized protein n=1 Tax=Dryococelus australis TaxID=614101 RepID=A0ABQ9G6G4_9NEOP|nr:hypothetical protein PR048_031859 [Dryococelus australis]
MLSGYDFELCYWPVPSIANADGLSRIPTPETEVPAPMEVVIFKALDAPPLTARQIAELTRADPVLSRVLQGWPSGNHGDEYVPLVRRQHELKQYKNISATGIIMANKYPKFHYNKIRKWPKCLGVFPKNMLDKMGRQSLSNGLTIKEYC